MPHMSPSKISSYDKHHERMVDDTPGFDMEHRDPNAINTFVHVGWDDLVAEPEGIRSADCIWRNSYKIFRCSQICCYNFLSALCCLPISLCIGFRFACVSFQHIWCLTPLVRDLKINCHVLRTVGSLCCDTACGPCYETIGLVFSRFKFVFLTQKGHGHGKGERCCPSVEHL